MLHRLKTALTGLKTKKVPVPHSHFKKEIVKHVINNMIKNTFLFINKIGDDYYQLQSVSVYFGYYKKSENLIKSIWQEDSNLNYKS